jgi:hypothetical protein
LGSIVYERSSLKVDRVKFKGFSANTIMLSLLLHIVVGICQSKSKGYTAVIKCAGRYGVKEKVTGGRCGGDQHATREENWSGTG